MQPTAEALAARHLTNGDGDLSQLTEEVLNVFRQALDIRAYEPSLRLRISTLLQEIVSRRGN
jgi:hypothetical protein